MKTLIRIATAIDTARVQEALACNQLRAASRPHQRTTTPVGRGHRGNTRERTRTASLAAPRTRSHGQDTRGELGAELGRALLVRLPQGAASAPTATSERTTRSGIDTTSRSAASRREASSESRTRRQTSPGGASGASTTRGFTPREIAPAPTGSTSSSMFYQNQFHVPRQQCSTLLTNRDPHTKERRKDASHGLSTMPAITCRQTPATHPAGTEDSFDASQQPTLNGRHPGKENRGWSPHRRARMREPYYRTLAAPPVPQAGTARPAAPGTTTSAPALPRHQRHPHAGRMFAGTPGRGAGSSGPPRQDGAENPPELHAEVPGVTPMCSSTGHRRPAEHPTTRSQEHSPTAPPHSPRTPRERAPQPAATHPNDPPASGSGDTGPPHRPRTAPDQVPAIPTSYT